jgi:hypothetical protein
MNPKWVGWWKQNIVEIAQGMYATRLYFSTIEVIKEAIAFGVRALKSTSPLSFAPEI